MTRSSQDVITAFQIAFKQLDRAWFAVTCQESTLDKLLKQAEAIIGANDAFHLTSTLESLLDTHRDTIAQFLKESKQEQRQLTSLAKIIPTAEAWVCLDEEECPSCGKKGFELFIGLKRCFRRCRECGEELELCSEPDYVWLRTIDEEAHPYGCCPSCLTALSYRNADRRKCGACGFEWTLEQAKTGKK